MMKYIFAGCCGFRSRANCRLFSLPAALPFLAEQTAASQEHYKFSITIVFFCDRVFAIGFLRLGFYVWVLRLVCSLGF